MTEVNCGKKKRLIEIYSVMFSEYPDIVTVAQLQNMLGISRHLAYDLINGGSIPGVKIGNALKVPKVNVIQYALGFIKTGNENESAE